MGNLNLFIEFKINRADICLFHGKWTEEEFFKREPVFIYASFWMVWYGGPQVSRQNQIATAKQKRHGKTKKLRQNKKPRQSKNHGKIKKPRQNKKATAK